MDVWYQCEIPYPHVPQDVLDRASSVRASLPNRYCDPRVAADLFEECIDEFLLCDERGSTSSRSSIMPESTRFSPRIPCLWGYSRARLGGRAS
jgi:hypothetical protein